MNFAQQLLDALPVPPRFRLARYAKLLPRIATLESNLEAETDAQLAERLRALRYRAQCREPLATLVVETYALVREAARRAIGLRHHDVQILGGLALFDGGIAEMQTGEGKTLVATLPLVLRALSGRGAWLATANDYLAERDAAWMGQVYQRLGLTTGVVLGSTPRERRQPAYACDITYGTAREFGFDFLRDRLALREAGGQALSWLHGGDFLAAAGPLDPWTGTGQTRADTVQRPAHFILVDEADSLLIDEARTPLILSGGPPETAAATAAGCQWAAAIASQFVEKEHYEFDDQRRRLTLNAAGRDKVRSITPPRELDGLKMFLLYEFVERAILVSHNFLRDKQYVIRDGEIVIVDEYTGRISEGRRWQAGIHQAIEAKEGVSVTSETQLLARITVQDFFLRFPHLAGMTGTASPAAAELRQLYRLRVIPIPTHKPSRRERLPDRVYATADEKWQAVVTEATALQQTGRPVLIGTRSIRISEELSARLTAAGIEHAVLNARDPAAEAGIVARAGETGKVTVATNMAGRGTDIELGPGVRELGGLFVIGTEMHDSARIDRQLVGRCGRQGDPGTFVQFLALDDELLRTAFGDDAAERFAQKHAAALRSNPIGQSQQLSRQFARAQRIIERRQRRDRVQLQHFETRRHRMHEQLGQDPYLDSPE
ncbi:MAG: preprotein translocase subunit SecA [Planctomycetes bacterium]|nr:preprotein translocase subunit SecA [Planctomycetota bacterium]